ncbi:DUF4390 domain-containing protein [Nitrosomonas sp.]|uniref:DUF4390 domain-containing protein n=1 Tax=Nitrosomonas sp. TaxID=42353 RepID=UPI0025E60443|nr:DUF4390 domain-containing protein [Nitrosomonas sp.]
MSHIVWLLMPLLLILPMTVVQAEGIQIKSFSLVATDKGYEMGFDSEIMLNATLEQALEKGIVLYFVTKFSLIDSRWYWLNDEVARSKYRVGLRYYALTRQYHLNTPLLSHSYNSLREALQALGQLRAYPVDVKSELKWDADYFASLRIWLDLTRMPKPFQVEALGSNQWNLSSEKLEWRMKLPAPEQPFYLKVQ